MTLLERDPLLAELNGRLVGARRGQGSFVLVSGEAGIGKTALVDAFIRGVPRGTRVLRGSCDPVVPPRAFAPLSDMAMRTPNGLRAALDAADRDRVFERFLRLIRDQGSGAAVVFEDLHWADSATLDLLRVVGRRLPETPILLIGTFRAHDLDDEHPLRATLGDIPSRVIVELQVPPLTAGAVEALSAGSGIDGAGLHEVTGGNAFFVTEILAVGGATTVPPTVRDAVAARVARLSPDGRRALEAAAVLGGRVEARLITTVALTSAPASGLRECISRQLMQEHEGVVMFRHELARRAVLERLAPDDRVELNRRALAALQQGVVPADDARMVQHAIEGGAVEAVATLAPRAAQHAAGLGAHGEAADYLAIALAQPSGTDDRARAELHERYAYECSVSGRVAAARTAQETALESWRRLGDRLREGDARRALSMYMWHGGEGDIARDMARLAVAVLEQVEPAGRELAHAYAKLAQLLLNSAQDDAAARGWAARARDLAERIGDEPVAVHALTTLAVLDTYAENPTGPLPRGWQALEGALARARAAGLSDDIARILINLVETARDARRYDLADRYLDKANEYLRDRDFDLYSNLLRSRHAQLELQRGNWMVADRVANELLDGRTRASQARSRALGVLGLLRARRGEPGVWDALEEAVQVAGRGELQEICPLHAIRAEAAWLEGDLARAGDEAATGLALATPTGAPFWYSEVSFWAWRTGRIDVPPEGTFQPYALHAAGRHREAADVWLAVESPYEAALALADSLAEDDLREALRLFQRLDGRTMALRISTRLRERGARHVSRGPRPSTRANPGGLSERELEVLQLIGAGARNVDIAERLVLSPKTVDHHVSAILRKLGAADRAAARRIAVQLGIKDGGGPRAT